MRDRMFTSRGLRKCDRELLRCHAEVRRTQLILAALDTPDATFTVPAEWSADGTPFVVEFNQEDFHEFS